MTEAARPSLTRRDRSGVLSATLDELLDAGRRLHAGASTITTAADLTIFGAEHRAWVLSCIPVLGGGFEAECVSEFVHVNSRVKCTGDVSAGAKAARATTRDALELLLGLRHTLDLGPRTDERC